MQDELLKTVAHLVLAREVEDYCQARLGLFRTRQLGHLWAEKAAAAHQVRKELEERVRKAERDYERNNQ